MPVTKTMVFTATPPTTGETPTVFNYNAIACWNDLKLNIIPDLNTAFTQMNALETNVNAKEASTVYSADIASAASNYQGEWTSKGYTLGQSVSSGTATYMCKLTHATGFAVTNTTYWQPMGYAAIVNGATEKTVPVDADIIGIGDSAASFVLKKLTWANIKATILSSFGVMISTATEKTVPVDADIFIIGDSAATNASKKTTWANIKSVMNTYIATIYAPIASPAFTGTPTAKNFAYKQTPVTITSWSYVGTTITLNVASHTFVAGDYIEVGGLTATTNIPNGVHLVTSVTATTIVFTYASTPTGTAGVSSATVKGYMTTNGGVENIGVGQTWQNVLGSRALGTTYTNSTGKAIQISICCVGSGAIATLEIASIALGSVGTTNGDRGQLSGIVPNGSSYRVFTSIGTPTIELWAELR